MKSIEPKKVTKNGKTQWMIRWTFQGKTSRRYFPSEAKAKVAARKEDARRENLSAPVAQVATDDFIRKAVELAKRLEDHDTTLEDAVNDFIKRLEAEGKSITLGELREKYIEDKRREGLKPRTIKEAESKSKVIVDAFGAEKKIATISPNQIARWLNELEIPASQKEADEEEMKPASDQTKNNYRRIFHAMMEFATKFHSLDKNPVSMVSKKSKWTPSSRERRENRTSSRGSGSELMPDSEDPSLRTSIGETFPSGRTRSRSAHP